MIRTLVVDDDFRVAELHREYVARVDGFTVVGTAHTGLDALDAVDRLRPDLVLLDFYLPDISGLEVLRRLREDGHPPVDIVAITAARDVDSLRSAMHGGVVHYLVKPFRMAVLEARLKAYLVARRRLSGLGEATQAEVDRIFAALRSPGPAEPLPKGLTSATLEVIVEALQEAPQGLTANEVSEATGLSRVTARRYLDHLANVGSAGVSRRYGAPGRPEHKYRMTAP